MLEETLERLERAKNTYAELVAQGNALINAIEAAITHADLAISQNRDAADMAGIAFNVRGGAAGGGGEIGAANRRLVEIFNNTRSMLSSARLTAEQAPNVAQAQIDTIDNFIATLRG